MKECGNFAIVHNLVLWRKTHDCQNNTTLIHGAHGDRVVPGVTLHVPCPADTV